MTMSTYVWRVIQRLSLDRAPIRQLDHKGRDFPESLAELDLGYRACFRLANNRNGNRARSTHLRHILDLRPKDTPDNRQFCRVAL